MNSRELRKILFRGERLLGYPPLVTKEDLILLALAILVVILSTAIVMLVTSLLGYLAL
jgi:hypothetical protein